MNGFDVKISETTANLDAKMRVKLKDITNAVKLDEVTTIDDYYTITPCDYAILDVHNENSDNKDYKLFIIIDENGTKYVTGSPSFMNAFMGIWDEMKDEEKGSWSIQAYKRDSKNYKGKTFMTCSLA